jgi:adenine-specific DNA-methyltransferase
MDAIFGATNFRNEITWKRSHAHGDSKQGRRAYGNVADILLYYTRSDDYIFNTIFMPYDQAYIDKYYRYRDADGRRYWLDNLTGPGGASKGNPYYEVMGVSRYWRYSKKKWRSWLPRAASSRASLAMSLNTNATSTKCTVFLSRTYGRTLIR